VPDEYADYFEEKKDEIFYSLKKWYMRSMDCKGLNNEEIHEEYCKFLSEVEELDDTDPYNSKLIDKYTALLESRTKLTTAGRDNFRYSMGIAIECLSDFSLVENLCPVCGPKFGVEYLINAHYWMGFLKGVEEERNVSGITTVVQKATDARHSFNRARKMDIMDWYRKNRSKYKSKDDAAVDAAHKFHVAHSTARKHLIGI